MFQQKDKDNQQYSLIKGQFYIIHSTNVPHHIETSQLISSCNSLIVALNGLTNFVTGLFLYPMKTSKNQRIFYVFRV